MSESFPNLLFLAHLAATLFMTGIIWFVQVVHYPLFARIGAEDFLAYERQHTRLTIWVVAPPMLIEGATAVLLFWLRPMGVSTSQILFGLALIVIIWLSTAFLQVPFHERLSQRFDAFVHRQLVSTNWIRTAAWSSRGLLVLWMGWNALN
jgi:hypothetical protein